MITTNKDSAPVEFLESFRNFTDNNQPKIYPPGTRFMPVGKRGDICTVTDMLTTTNLRGETVGVRYVATHLFCGQTVTNSDVAAATIARGIERLNAASVGK